MIGQLLGDATFSGIPATGIVHGITVQQVQFTGISMAWDYAGYDAPDNIYFLIYLNGRFQQRVEGSARAASVIALSYDSQNVQVIPWRKSHQIPEDWYGSMATSRAHLEWARVEDSTVDHYNVYHSDSESGPYLLLAAHKAISLQTGYFDIGAATLQVSGVYAVTGEHTNTLFTLTITDAASNVGELSNDFDSTVLPVFFSPGGAFVLSGGIIGRVTGELSDGDSASFIAGVQPWYDTMPLESGSHWFKVAAVDRFFNESALSPAFPVTISAAPRPVTFFELEYDEATDKLLYSLIQSPDAAAASVRVYTNFDASCNVFLSSVFFDIPYTEIVLAPGVAGSGVLFDTSAMPAGVLRVVAQAVSASGLSDDTAAPISFTLPYVPPDLPSLFALTARYISAGFVRLEWLSKLPVPSNDPLLPGEWLVTGSHDTGFVRPVPEARYGQLGFAVDLEVAQYCGSDGQEIIMVQAVNPSHTRYGLSAIVGFESDSVPPVAISGITGTAY